MLIRLYGTKFFDRTGVCNHLFLGIRYRQPQPFFRASQGDHNITISMTEKGNPYENAIAERMNGILKHHFGLNRTFSNFTEASLEVDKAIRTYNNLYPHGSCNYLTPEQAHNQNGKLTSKWKQKQKETPVNKLQDYLTKL